MSPYMGRLALLLWVGLFVDVSPAHAQVKSAPVRAVPNAAPRRFLPRVGVTNTSGLQALTLNPDAVYAGQSSMVTVELPAPAPAGGAKVVLSASPAGVGTMPPAVTVAAGQSTGSFAVATASGGGNATLEISAARDGSTGKLSALLQVVAALPAITGFAGFPGLLRVGTSATGTVTIAGAAPAGGATIPLYPAVSGDAIVPASVTVAAGQSSASLTISAGQKTGTVKLSTSAVARQQGCPAAPPCASIQVVAVPELATLSFVGGMTTTEGGSSAAVTVGMSQPSPTPMTVSLSSSDAQVASVEASVRFTSDYTTGQAIVTTHRLSAPATVTVTATCAACQGTTSRSVTLQVVPALDVSTITVAPSGDIKGGAQATVTVTLTQAAGSAGANVALSTSNPTVCLVPKAVKVAAGQTTITVPISTQAVASPATVTLAAGTLGGGVQKSTTVRVVP